MRLSQSLFVLSLCLCLTTLTAQDLPPLEAEGIALNRESWEAGRRQEILGLFENHIYGQNHFMEVDVQSRLMYLDRKARDGKAVLKEVELLLCGEEDTISADLLLYLPADAKGPVPLFLGLNFYGNHSITADPGVSLPGGWLPNNEALHVSGNRAGDASRGVRTGRWPVDLILERGYGLATIYCGDFDPDFHDGFQNGVHALDPEPRDSSSWGTIAAWAWGLSRAMDYLEDDPGVDASRVAVIGHSRLGKTALWAGATDERFAMVVSNNSGCGGAALSRRKVGESVERINTVFPHWFADRFSDYNGNEAALPVDQHMLLALVAPRALYVASASEDEWADPLGEYLSLYHASRVWPLYGMDSLGSMQQPEAGSLLHEGRLGYHLRSGKHDITRWDWEQYLDFADENLAPSGEGSEAPAISMEWIAENLRPARPRLILDHELDILIRHGIENNDARVLGGLQAMRVAADDILEEELLQYNVRGRRLLGVSREALRRLTTLALVCRYQDVPELNERLEDEIRAVCSFPDWNPSHFLDVGEMATALSLALDWAGDELPAEVVALGKEALIEKAIKPGLAPSPSTFFTSVHHNWNLVCNGGLALAALYLFEDEPELSARILHQAIETIPLALEPYGPDGVYPEGVSYWSYATSYLALSLSAFESALGTDFGFSQAPGLQESVLFSKIMAGPSGEYYNFFDAGSGGYMGLSHLGLQAWFARRGACSFPVEEYDAMMLEEQDAPVQLKRTRLYPFFFLEISMLSRDSYGVDLLPEAWMAGGDEPIAVLRDAGMEEDDFFLAAKGGCARDNHGNMDAGSFIFELDGVRWSVDPGNQGYYELEQIMGMDLWRTDQESPRWDLLTKNNFGHSTLSVNGRKHLVDERAVLISFDLRGAEPAFSFDLGGVLGPGVIQAERCFSRTAEHSFRILDRLHPAEGCPGITWQMLTTAELSIQKNYLVLEQDGKQLYLVPDPKLQPEVRIVELSPPPLEFDKDIPGLKRIELYLEDLPGDAFELIVDISAEKPE